MEVVTANDVLPHCGGSAPAPKRDAPVGGGRACEPDAHDCFSWGGMTDDEAGQGGADRIAQAVGAFYERHPYPPPVDDLDRYRQAWDDARRRADAHLFWPAESYRDDRSILVAGCGTSQVAKYALRWPNARVTGIDLSAASIEETRKLKHRYGLENLELHQLPVERVVDLGRSFEQVVCTGVLHHLSSPDTGLRALREVLEPGGAMHLMLYAPYGRAGIYMLQEYCRRLGIGTTRQEIQELAASLDMLPAGHALIPLLHNARDFQSEAGLADALLHPQDRAYSVPEALDFLCAADLVFGRWILQAPYLPYCGAPLVTPHHALLAQLDPEGQFAAMELFRGTMRQHSLIAYRNDRVRHAEITFDDEAWLDYVPIRKPDTIAVQERLPAESAAVLINRSHSYADIYLPIDARQKVLFDAIDGSRSIGELAPDCERRQTARILFERLWRYDQVVFDLSYRPTRSKADAGPCNSYDHQRDFL
ncbi:class I SAM-dependent methyltransferase [Luteimonas sp. A649]